MRIIGGELRRRRLLTPPDGATTRPMPDLVRESLFNLLRGHTENQVVLDLFAGTGSVGLEAISRGAARCVFVETRRPMARLIERNIESLGVGARCEVVVADALSPRVLTVCPRPVHLVFADPPYALARDPRQWPILKRQLSRLAGLLDAEGYLVLRTPWPFLHRIEEETRAPARPRRGRQRRELDEDGEEMIEIDHGEDDGPAGEDVARYEAPSLEIEGAVGPETHAYGRTAIHLYAPRR